MSMIIWSLGRWYVGSISYSSRDFDICAPRVHNLAMMRALMDISS